MSGSGLQGVRVAALALLATALFTRCHCGGSTSNPRERERYQGVGDECTDDLMYEYGCGLGSPRSETCDEGLACCGSRCVASGRCGTADPGGGCNSDRDCTEHYYCVDRFCFGCVDRACLAGDGISCTDDDECVSGNCRDGSCSSYLDGAADLSPNSDGAVAVDLSPIGDHAVDSSLNTDVRAHLAADGDGVDAPLPDAAAPDGRP